jgi:hypothetical protein
VFANRLKLAERAESMNLYANLNALTITALSEKALGVVRVGDGDISLDDVLKQYTVSDGLSGVDIEIPPGSIELSGTGAFALSEDAYFSHAPGSVNPLTDVNAAGINYIIARYQKDQPRMASFDLSRASIRDHTLRFLIAMPGFKYTDDPLKLNDISVTLEREAVRPDSLYRHIKEYLKYYIQQYVR